MYNWAPQVPFGFMGGKSPGFDWKKLFGGGFWGGPGGMAIASFGLPLLGNMLGGGRRQEQAFNQWQSQRQNLMSPTWMSNRIGGYQQQMNQLAAPSRAAILTNQNAFQQSLGRNLAASGMNRTGIGALASTAASSMAGQNFMDLASETRRGSMQLAMNDRDQLMRMLSEGPMYNENPVLGSIASGGNTFMQYLLDRYRPKG